MNDKIKPLIGLISVSLAGLFLLVSLIFFILFLSVEFHSWSVSKTIDKEMNHAHLVAIEANLIGAAVDKYPGYVTYLKTQKG